MVRTKFKTIILIVLLVVLMGLGGCAAVLSPAKNQNVEAFVVANDVDSARDDIEKAGGRIVHIFPDDKVLMGKVPYGFESDSVSNIYYEGSKKGPGDKKVLFDVWLNNLAWKNEPTEKKLAKIDKDVPENPGDDVVFDKDVDISALKSYEVVSTYEPGLTDTSEYMIGDVAVSIMTIESDETVCLDPPDCTTYGPDSEDWTPSELSQVYSEIINGLSWWVAREPNAHLTFVYNYEEQLPTTYEPINSISAYFYYYYLPDIMLDLGYGTGANGDKTGIYDYINNMRSSEGTDWGFVIYVIDSSADDDGKFSDGKSAFTISKSNYVNGLYFVMTYDNGNYGITNMDLVAAHETGHIFGALDQYGGCDCTRNGGYLNYANENCVNSCLLSQSSIMKDPINAFALELVDDYARGQVGWQDSNPSDGILDVLGGLPNNNLHNYSPDPELNSIISYTGSSNINVYPALNPYYNDISINWIKDGLYMYQGDILLVDTPVTFPWDTLTAEFNQQIVPYSFMVDVSDPSSWGEYIFTTKILDRFDNEQLDSDSLTIYGCVDEEDGAYAYDGSAYSVQTDSCDGSTLVQYNCDGAFTITAEPVNCPYGCSDAKCMNRPKITPEINREPIL